MVKRCFVANCKTGRGRKNEQKFSLFKAPKDEALLEKWRKAVPLRDREFTNKDFICEKHFEKQYVTPRFQQSRLGDYYEDHIRPRLAPNAIPTVFYEDSRERALKPYKVLNDNNGLLANVFKQHLDINESDTVPICYKCLLGKCSVHVVICNDTEYTHLYNI